MLKKRYVAIIIVLIFLSVSSVQIAFFPSHASTKYDYMKIGEVHSVDGVKTVYRIDSDETVIEMGKFRRFSFLGLSTDWFSFGSGKVDSVVSESVTTDKYSDHGMACDVKANIGYKYKKTQILGLINYQELNPYKMQGINSVNPRRCSICMDPPNDLNRRGGVLNKKEIIHIPDTMESLSKVDLQIRDQNISLITKIEKPRETSPQILLKSERIDWGAKNELYRWIDGDGVVHFSWSK